MHIAFARYPFGIYYMTNASGTWTRQRVTTQEDDHASLALDAAGKVHIAFDRIESAGDTVEARGVWLVTNVSGTWREYQRSSNPADILPSLRISSGKYHIAFVRNGVGVYYQTNATGSWVTTRAWTEPDVADAPSLRIGSGATPHIVYARSGFAGSRGIAYVKRVGGTWSRTMLTTGPDFSPALVLDGNGRGHIAFLRAVDISELESTTDTRYLTNASGAWVQTLIGRASLEGGNEAPSIVVDASNRALVVQGTDTGVRFRSNATGSWVTTRLSTHLARSASIRLDSLGRPRVTYERMPDAESIGGTYYLQRN